MLSNAPPALVLISMSFGPSAAMWKSKPKNTPRAPARARNGGRACQHLLAIGGQSATDSTAVITRCICRACCARQEHRHVREKVRMRFDQRSSDSRVAEPGIESPLQRGHIGAHALAFAIESVGALDGVGHAATLRSAKNRSSMTPTTAPTSCAAMNPGASAGRMPAKRVGERAPEVIAGFAKEVEAVNQYAAPIQAETRHAAAEIVAR